MILWQNKPQAAKNKPKRHKILAKIQIKINLISIKIKQFFFTLTLNL